MDERAAIQLGLDTLPDGVVLADGDGIVTHINARARQMLGGVEVGCTLAAAMRLQDQAGRDWFSRACPYDGLTIRRGIPEQSWLLPDGSEVLVTTGIHRAGPDRAVDRVAVSLRSGRGRARLDRERSDLVATVAHELRSPLTGVKGFVQALLNRWDRLNDEQKKLMLATVNADADRLARLIAELLDVARIDTDRLRIHPRPVDLAMLARRVVDSVAAGTARSIELQVEPGLPPGWADPDKFTQVLTNLVENGVRHGDGRVLVALSALAPDRVRIVVEDEGEGITAETGRRVFTKFWTEGHRGGSGLGLYIAHGLVRAHQGEITIGATEHGGARIAVEWPVAVAED